MELALLLGRFCAARRVEVRTGIVVVYKPSQPFRDVCAARRRSSVWSALSPDTAGELVRYRER
jgi:hypothetical protein